ncbi:hypothetical protein NKJ88_31460 [Mesorhizobium sp. M0016]|uniref:hypothetical protein n=1 Tax=Mesorhizobium sp. M0016 TaxID=2956843 RepID=UPI00333570EA
MLDTFIQTNRIVGDRLSDNALQEHRPLVVMSGTSNGIGTTNGEVVSTLARPSKLASAGAPTLAHVDFHADDAETAVGARLASVDIYAVGALLHSLNLQLRDSARLDRQVSRDCDIAAQNAAAKALRASGSWQLIGALLTSALAIAGAGVSFKGAGKAQARFDAEVGAWKAQNGKTSFQAEMARPGTKPDLDIPEGSQPHRVPVNPATKPDPDIPEGSQPASDLAKAAPKLADTLPEGGQPPPTLARRLLSCAPRLSHRVASRLTTLARRLLNRPQRHSHTVPSRPHDLGKAAPKLDPETLPQGGQPPSVDLTGIYRAQQAAHTTTMTWSGVATGMSEVGKIAGAGSNMGATIEQAKKAKLDAEDTEIRSRAEDETEYKSAYERMIQGILETLSEVRRADAETRSKIANMG